MKETILIIEDDKALAMALQDYLEARGYTTLHADSCARSIELIERCEPDLCLVDWLLPDGDGPTICERIKLRKPAMPVVMMTCRSDTDSLLEGLYRGADDYWMKPLNLREALARIEARLRGGWARQHSEELQQFGPLTISFEKRECFANGSLMDLNDKEFGILEFLYRHKGKPVTRASLLSAVWGYRYVPNTRTVDNYIVSLRRKLEPLFGTQDVISTVRGRGYRLTDPSDAGTKAKGLPADESRS